LPTTKRKRLTASAISVDETDEGPLAKNFSFYAGSHRHARHL